jgi:hypothetical protein
MVVQLVLCTHILVLQEQQVLQEVPQVPLEVLQVEFELPSKEEDLKGYHRVAAILGEDPLILQLHNKNSKLLQVRDLLHISHISEVWTSRSTPCFQISEGLRLYLILDIASESLAPYQRCNHPKRNCSYVDMLIG